MASYDDVMSLSVRRGFLWPAVELYGGFGGFYDYGHNGVLLRRREIPLDCFISIEIYYSLRALPHLTSKGIYLYSKRGERNEKVQVPEDE